jgi:thymidylate synthase (FAD)
MPSIDILSRIPNKKVNLLDHGYIMLVDCMPRLVEEGRDHELVDSMDTAIVNAARTSYSAGRTKPLTKDRDLIRRLMREYHTSPFEQCEFKFEIKAPIYVHRQLLRHRTASVNEESGRYSILKDEMHLPTSFRQNTSADKQATVDIGNWEPLTTDGQKASMLIEEYYETTYNLYRDLLDSNISREQARIVLPVATYSTLVWKMDLLNLLKFCRLRSDLHAQYEIRIYSDQILDWIKILAPNTYEAFMDYWVNSVTFSPAEIQILKTFILHKVDFNKLIDYVNNESPSKLNLSKGETNNLIHKISNLKLDKD